MGNTVFKIEEITLLDGTEVTLRPLSIAQYRKFVKVVNQRPEENKEMTSDDIFEAGLEYISKLAVFCLQQMNETKNQTAESLEDVLDQETAAHVIKVCGGLDFTDDNPKVREMMERD